MSKIPVVFDGSLSVAAEDVVAIKRHQGVTFVHVPDGRNFVANCSFDMAMRKWRDALRLGGMPAPQPPQGSQALSETAAELAAEAVQEPPRTLVELQPNLGCTLRTVWLAPGDGEGGNVERPAHDMVVLAGLVTVSIGTTAPKLLSAGGRISFDGPGFYAYNADSKALIAFITKTPPPPKAAEPVPPPAAAAADAPKPPAGEPVAEVVGENRVEVSPPPPEKKSET